MKRLEQMTRLEQKKRMNRMAVIAVALAVAGLAGCDGMGTSPDGEDADPGDARIVATVTEDGSAAEGDTVRLYDQGDTTALQTATTDTAGEAVFTMLEAATYEVEVSVPSGFVVASGDSARKAVTVAESGEATVSFPLVAEAVATDTVEVTLTNYAFTPADLTISPNTMVRWVNDTNTFHTITPDGHSEWSEGEVDEVGETFTHVFTEQGSFPYYCSPHRSLGMEGSVTVQ